MTGQKLPFSVILLASIGFAPWGTAQAERNRPAKSAPLVKVSGQVVDAADRPVRGANVALFFSARNPPRVRNYAGRWYTETQADGRFELSAPPGEWSLTAKTRRFAPVKQWLLLEAGKHRTGVVLKCSPGSAIRGVVVDDLGKPVAGAALDCATKTELSPGVFADDFHSTSRDTAQSDVEGRFEIRGVTAASPVRVTASKWWYETHAVTVSPKQRTGLRFQLLRHGTVAGVLVDRTGRGIGGSGVKAYSVPWGWHGASGRSDASGRFTIRGVRPGRYSLVAEGPGHLPASVRGIQVRAGQTTEGVKLRADLGARIVVAVVNAGGQPVDGARVFVREFVDQPEAAYTRLLRPEWITPPSGAVSGIHRVGQRLPLDDLFYGSLYSGCAAGYTDAVGRAVVTGLPSGPAKIIVGHPKFALGSEVDVVVRDDRTVEAKVTMPRAGSVTVKTLQRDGSVRSCRFRLTGPLASDRDSWTLEFASPKSGIKRVGPLAVGRYRATLCREGTRINIIELVTSAVEFEVTEGVEAKVEVRVPVLPSIRGVVSDASGPVAGIGLTLGSVMKHPGSGMLPIASVASGADGSYELRHVEPGLYVLQCSKSATFQHEITIVKGQADLRRDVVLGDATIRVAVVRGEDGKGLYGAEVRLHTSVTKDNSTLTASFADVTLSNGQGDAAFERIAPGTYVVTVTKRGRVERVFPGIVIKKGQQLRLPPVKLKVAAQIRGKVTVGIPRLGEDVFVDYRLVGGEASQRGKVRGGFFWIDGLEAGEYELRARTWKYATHEKTGRRKSPVQMEWLATSDWQKVTTVAGKTVEVVLR